MQWVTTGMDKGVWDRVGRAWTILVCDFRLGMGKEGLLPHAICCVIFWSLGICSLSPGTLAFWNPYSLHPVSAIPP